MMNNGTCGLANCGHRIGVFGGTVAEVIGGAVAADEKAMLAGIIR